MQKGEKIKHRQFNSNWFQDVIRVISILQITQCYLYETIYLITKHQHNSFVQSADPAVFPSPLGLKIKMFLWSRNSQSEKADKEFYDWKK